MKGGINFEEWKEIVKKNRRSLRSKSNIFRFEPESLTYGAEKAVKSPEYGQVHTITYNVTGMDIPSDWPTEIKSKSTLVLSGITALYGGNVIFNLNKPYDYSKPTGKLTIKNVQEDLTVGITIIPPMYENANTGDYLYDDWTFGRTNKDNWIAICVGKTEDNTKSIWWGRSFSDPIKWSTELVDTNLENYSSGTLAYVDMDGKANTEYLLSLGIDKYPAAAWASQQFGGLGYLPSAGEIHKYYDTFKYWSSFGQGFRTQYIWSSTEKSAGYAFVKERDAILGSHKKDETSYWNGGATYNNYAMAFCQLSGPCGRPQRKANIKFKVINTYDYNDPYADDNYGGLFAESDIKTLSVEQKQELTTLLLQYAQNNNLPHYIDMSDGQIKQVSDNSVVDVGSGYNSVYMEYSSHITGTCIVEGYRIDDTKLFLNEDQSSTQDDNFGSSWQEYDLTSKIEFFI